MTEAFSIRPLGPGDQPAWTPLWRAYLAFYDTTLPPEQFDLTFARHTDPKRTDMRGWLAWDGEKAIGLVHIITHAHGWSVDDVTYLQDLYTAPQARGRGVARALIEAVYADADVSGRPAVYWLTQRGNATARRLYDQVGVETEFMKYIRG